MIVKVCTPRRPAKSLAAGSNVATPVRKGDSNLSRGMGGLVRYLVGPGKANEHTNPSLVAGLEPFDSEYGDADWTDPQWGRQTTAEFVRQMNQPMVKKRLDGELPENRGWVFHAVLSAPPGERHDHEVWGDMSREFIKQMGFAYGDESPCRWAAFHHGQSSEGNDHVHVVVQMIREDGSWADNNRSFKRAAEARRVIEKKFGLAAVEQTARERGSANYTQAEERRVSTIGKDGAIERNETDREKLRRLMLGAAEQARSEADYVKTLWRSGVLTRPRYAKGTRDVVTGYSVALRPEGDAKPIYYGGKRIHPDLSLPAIRSMFPDTPEAASEAARAWNLYGGNGASPKPVQADPRAVQSARHILDEHSRQWEAKHLANPAARAALSRHMTGVLAVTAQQLEPSGRGPLMRATNSMLHHASQAAENRIREENGGERFGRAARVLARASSNSPLAWMAVLQQLQRASEALEDAHKAAHDLASARELHRTVTEPLIEVRSQLGASPGPGHLEPKTGMRAASQHVSSDRETNSER